MPKNSNKIVAVLRFWYGSRLPVIAESVLIGLATGFLVVGFRLLLNRNDRLRSAVYQKLAGVGGYYLIEALTLRDTLLRILILLFGAKLLFTALSYGSGTAGGIFLPLLVCDALAGDAFGKIVALPGLAKSGQVLNSMILSMAAFFTAVVKAPVTGTVLILEMA